MDQIVWCKKMMLFVSIVGFTTFIIMILVPYHGKTTQLDMISFCNNLAGGCGRRLELLVVLILQDL